ncbi:MAG: TetR/AcrR family transcriptional regulator [Atopobiaceae bacterium]|nr:TetR/AcrR family transcriptional regulator [Atopobiaceae bacterium]
MRTTTTKDLRVTKTLEAIDSSFRSLMLEVGYERITVKALCDRARINKKTFYRYYDTLDDLLAELMATYAAAWRKRTTHLHEPEDLEEVTREFFRFGSEQDELYDAITCDPAYDVIQRRLQDDASGERVESAPAGLTIDQWHVYYSWQTAGTLAMYRAWVADGKRLPVEEVSDMAVTLLCKGVEGLLGS